ncbi:hypothetical protein AAHC03_04996 [Spirometra sp. Aus1]|nr:unnamed protein product [Spirometra erinaceieuropaei]
MEDLKETAELVFQANKIRMHLEHIDLSFPDGIRDCASKLHMTYGRVTIVISNAGVVNGKYLLDLAGEDVERVFKVNFFAAFHLIKAFLPGMLGSIFEETYERIPAPLRTSQPLSAVSKAPPHGRFIFTSSITGQIPCLGLSDYCASKAALSILAESFRLELIRLGVGDKITITDIRPYVIDTGMFDGFKSRFPRIFPVQTKEATVARIIKAIREREYIVYIPWSMTLFPIIKHLFPDRIVRFIYDSSGATTAMDNFTGRNTKTL